MKGKITKSTICSQYYSTKKVTILEKRHFLLTQKVLMQVLGELTILEDIPKLFEDLKEARIAKLLIISRYRKYTQNSLLLMKLDQDHQVNVGENEPQSEIASINWYLAHANAESCRGQLLQLNKNSPEKDCGKQIRKGKEEHPREHKKKRSSSKKEPRKEKSMTQRKKSPSEVLSEDEWEPQEEKKEKDSKRFDLMLAKHQDQNASTEGGPLACRHSYSPPSAKRERRLT
ncbi:hypothetical protein HNY73_013303 [Argiope bruennichi]|uniref:Uncharacterized protein n=1 Tax=Argiope bruennichi TaxID=94029 RepID=A0A8T0EZI8_ARGBR|nr:hypothetical protein HNY73_013303 [Argiope bruennichi]